MCTVTGSNPVESTTFPLLVPHAQDACRESRGFLKNFKKILDKVVKLCYNTL